MSKINYCKNSLRQKIIAFVYLIILNFMCQGYEVMAQTATDYKWNNVAIGGGGFVSGIITSKKQKDLVYIRTDVGGAYRWDASTSTWIPLMDWCSEDEVGYLGVESLAIDPQSPNKVYMLAGISYFSGGRTVILRSEDYGNTFTIIDVTSQFKADGNGMGRQVGERLVVDPNNSNILYCGTRHHGLFKSTDAGSTWNRLNSLDVTTTPNGTGISFVIMDGSSVSGGATQRLIVGVSRMGSTNLYRSDDGGNSFYGVWGATTTYMPHRAALAGDGDLYITYANGCGPHAKGKWSMNKGQIWKYQISKGALTDVTPSGYEMPFGGISIDPKNPERLVASSINAFWPQYYDKEKKKNVNGDRIFLSTDGGSNWVDVVNRGFTLDTDGVSWTYGYSIHWAGSIEFDPFNTEKVLVTSGNGLFVNDNISSSGTWRFEVRGIEETVTYDLVSIPNGPAISVVGDFDGFRHTDITKYAPIHEPKMGTTTALTVAAQNTSKMFRVGNEMYYSTDMGVSWTKCSMNGVKGQVALSADGKIVLHSPQKSTDTYRSTDNGYSWSKVSGLNFKEAKPVGDPVNSNKFYAYDRENGAVMVSTNGGYSFSQTGTVLKKGSKIIRVAPGKEGDLWIPLYENGLTRSTDSGKSFSTLSGISQCGAVGFGKAAPGANYPTIFIWGTINNVQGIYRSIDQGASWVRVNDDAHEYGGPGNGQFVRGDMNVFGRVYMSTAGRGIVYGTPATCTPSVITAYTRVNGGSWEQTASASLAAGGSVVFGPQPVKGGSWSWSGPNGFSATTQMVTLSNIESNQAGDYVATYTNSEGCQSTQTFKVTVASAASTACTPSTTTPYVLVNGGSWEQTSSASLAAGGSVAFGPQPAKGGSWSWSGPNGFSNTSQTVALYNIQSNQAGDYVATYTNSEGCQSTQTFKLTVCTPTAITAYTLVNGGSWEQTSSASLAAGGSVAFGPQPAKGGSWSWSGPNGFSSTSQTVALYNIQSNQAGDYVATYTNSEGCQSTQTFKVTLCTPSVITAYTRINGGSWEQTASASLAAGGSVVFGPQPVKGGSWNWSGPNGFSDTTQMVTLYNIQSNQAGDYVATYTNSGGCQSTQTFKVTLCTPSVITAYTRVNGGSWEQTASASLAAGGSVVFGPQPVKGGSWSWSGPNGFSDTTQMVTLYNIQSNQAGDYVATYTNSDGCQSTQTFKVTLCTPTVTTAYTLVNGGSWEQTASASLAVGGSVAFGPQPVKGGSWSWSGPDGFSSTSQTVALYNIQSKQAGDYVATYTNSDGCQSTQTFKLTVCTPTAITAYTLVNGGSWHQTASASVTEGASVTFGPHPNRGGSWRWSGPNGFSVSNRTVTISNIESKQAGDYVATYTNSEGCQSTQTFKLTVNSASSSARTGATEPERVIEAGNELTDVVIYPNPATEGRFTIALPETVQTVSVNIFDYQGRLLFEKTEKSISTLNIDSKLRGGIYLVKIRSEKFDIERKLMIR